MAGMNGKAGTLNRKGKLQSRRGLEEKGAGGEHPWRCQNKGLFGCSIGNAVTCAFFIRFSPVLWSSISRRGEVGALVSLTVKQGSFLPAKAGQPPLLPWSYANVSLLQFPPPLPPESRHPFLSQACSGPAHCHFREERCFQSTPLLFLGRFLHPHPPNPSGTKASGNVFTGCSLLLTCAQSLRTGLASHLCPPLLCSCDGPGRPWQPWGYPLPALLSPAPWRRLLALSESYSLGSASLVPPLISRCLPPPFLGSDLCPQSDNVRRL